MNIFSRIPWRYYGVWLLPLGGLMGFAGYGTILYTYPVFFPVITKEFGWSAAVAATASSLARLEGGPEAPIVGYLLDKYGPRAVMLVCGLMMGLGLIALSWMNADSIVFYYIVFGIVTNLGYNAGLYTSSYKAVNNWWVKWRARAISIMILPTAIAGTFGPAVGTWIILNYGWRTGLIVMGVLVLVVYMPAAAFVRPKRPEAYGLLPDGDDPKAVSATSTGQKLAEERLAQETLKKEVDWTLGQAMKSSIFWVYTAAATFAAFAGGTVLLFAPSQLMSRGFDPMTAAYFAGFMMTLTYLGRFTVMAIGDLTSQKWQLCFAWLCQGLGCLSIANATPDASFLAFGYCFFYGLGYGMSIPLGGSIRAWLFGRGSFGKIYGMVAGISSIGGIIAPTFAGWMYDMNGTYYLAYTAMGLSFIASGVIFAFGRRPAPKTIPTTVTSAA